MILIRAGLLLLALSAMLTACGPVRSGARLADPAPTGRCGFHAAKDYRQSEHYRENPPACDLPGKDELAQSCAIQDRISAPDYHPEYDEEGSLANFVPLPEYQLSNLRCAFTGTERNRATCTFSIATPDMKALIPSSATLRHHYWRDDGPAHHFEGTRWSLDGSCLPKGRQSTNG